MTGPDIKELERQSIAFERRFNEAKESLAAQGIVWYPYPTLKVFSILARLLTGPRRHLVDLAAGDTVLDIGCGDGGISFFFESLGCQVRALDSYHTNHNHLKGFLELRTVLQSSVPLEVMDLDSQFTLPDDPIGLAVCLGVLYHLKNPFYVLEKLAAHARYCLLSTRIAQRTPAGRRMDDEPLAYLLGPGETNNDWTNYWIFSETALRRLLDRTGWNILDFLNTGAVRDSDPTRGDRDERAFCLLESRTCARYSVRLLEGWYALEENSYRWTERRFSIEIRRPALLKPSMLRFNFRLVGAGPVTMAAAVNGEAAEPARFTGEGEHCFEIAIPKKAREAAAIRFDFEAAGEVPGRGVDERDLALLVAFWRPGMDGANTIVPFELA